MRLFVYSPLVKIKMIHLQCECPTFTPSVVTATFGPSACESLLSHSLPVKCPRPPACWPLLCLPMPRAESGRGWGGGGCGWGGLFSQSLYLYCCITFDVEILLGPPALHGYSPGYAGHQDRPDLSESTEEEAHL